MKMLQMVEPSEASSQNDAEEMSKYGIRKVSIEYFYHGMYGYLDLKDAIAQARRELRAAVKSK